MCEESLKDSEQHQGILETMSALSMARVQVPRNFSDAVISHVINPLWAGDGRTAIANAVGLLQFFGMEGSK